MARRARRGVAGLAAGWLVPGVCLAQAAPVPGDAPAEIVVTAQKRAEPLQKAPIAVEVLGSATLEQHNVHSFQDYAALLPSLTYDTLGPGQSQIYFRGLTNGNGLAAGSLPTVGVYLDEQPVTTIGQALDIHMVDIARIEALPGPQGTLYGASSEAGTLRIITNKPDPARLSGEVAATIQSVAHGSSGPIFEGFINVPLTRNVAVRLVGYDEQDPGYIDNVATHAQVYEPSGVVRDNRAIAGQAINRSEVAGGRAMVKADFGDWSILAGAMGQHLKAHGVPAYRASLGDLQNTRFFAESYRDDWVQASLTVTGRVGPLDLTYAGAAIDRRTQYVSDYTDYSYYYDQYYTYYSAMTGTPNPAANYVDNAGHVIGNAQVQIGHQHYTKFSNEVRLSLPKTNGFQFVIGAFAMHQRDDWINLYEIAGLADALSVTGYPGVNYANIQQRTDRDYAVFGQASYDVTPRLALTLGLRGYWYDNRLIGFFGYGANNALGAAYGEANCDPATIGHTPGGGQPCNNVDARVTGSGIRHKVNLAWQIDPARLVYATWSTGYRPGGVNRDPIAGVYRAEKLTNYEAGVKTRWFGRRLQINADVFYERVTDAQFGLASDEDGIEVITNSGRAHSWGVEGDLTLNPARGLSLAASGALVTARIDSNLCLYADPTFRCDGPVGGDPTRLNTLSAPAGTRFPLNPRFKGSATLRYEFAAAPGEGHAQATVHTQSGFVSSIAPADNAVWGDSRAYASLDLNFGFSAGHWSADLTMANVFDSRGDINRYTPCNADTCGTGSVQVVPIQPRLVSLRLGYKF